MLSVSCSEWLLVPILTLAQPETLSSQTSSECDGVVPSFRGDPGSCGASTGKCTCTQAL